VRALLVLVALAGCGRSDFAEHGDGGARPRCTGHDEDGDGFPDACDVCPADPDPDQRDTDGDGVGDACDPRPTEAGDSLAVFESNFDQAAAVYSSYFGVSSFPGNDRLRLGSVAPSDTGQAVYALPANASRVEVAFTIVDQDDTAIHYAGVWYVTCTTVGCFAAVFANTGTQPAESDAHFTLKEQSEPMTVRYSTGLAVPRDQRGRHYQLVVETALATGADDRLTVRADDGTSRVTTLHIAIARTTAGYLEARCAVVDFDYLAIWAR
jgi:hypothetical protein